VSKCPPSARLSDKMLAAPIIPNPTIGKTRRRASGRPGHSLTAGGSRGPSLPLAPRGQERVKVVVLRLLLGREVRKTDVFVCSGKHVIKVPLFRSVNGRA
jgi:hypothetical protein